jgi:hypothetical protein
VKDWTDELPRVVCSDLDTLPLGHYVVTDSSAELPTEVWDPYTQQMTTAGPSVRVALVRDGSLEKPKACDWRIRSDGHVIVEMWYSLREVHA